MVILFNVLNKVEIDYLKLKKKIKIQIKWCVNLFFFIYIVLVDGCFFQFVFNFFKNLVKKLIMFLMGKILVVIFCYLVICCLYDFLKYGDIRYFVYFGFGKMYFVLYMDVGRKKGV